MHINNLIALLFGSRESSTDSARYDDKARTTTNSVRVTVIVNTTPVVDLYGTLHEDIYWMFSDGILMKDHPWYNDQPIHMNQRPEVTEPLEMIMYKLVEAFQGNLRHVRHYGDNKFQILLEDASLPQSLVQIKATTAVNEGIAATSCNPLETRVTFDWR